MNSDLRSSVFRNGTHSKVGIALAEVKIVLKFGFFEFGFRNCAHPKTEKLFRELISIGKCGQIKAIIEK